MPYTIYSVVTEFLRKSILGDFRIFVVSGHGKHAELIGAICFFIGYPENAKYPPNKNCVSCPSRKIVGKLVYLSGKIKSLDQEHKIIMKVANHGVSKLCIWFKDIKSLGKLPISV